MRDRATRSSVRLGKFFKELRESAGLSQNEVGEKLGYNSGQFVCNWERGIAPVPTGSIKTLAKLYKVKPAMIAELIVEEYRTYVERMIR